MSKQKYLLHSMDGKSSHALTITRDFREWSDRKCWNVHCGNSIMIVHLSHYGNATHGYCFWCYRTTMLFDCLYGRSDSGKWVEVIKSKLKVRNDRESFEKILRQKYGKSHNIRRKL